jgi:hypothetical protein
MCRWSGTSIADAGGHRLPGVFNSLLGLHLRRPFGQG